MSHRIHAVGRDAAESQNLCGNASVQRKGGTRQGTRAQGGFIQRIQSKEEPPSIPMKGGEMAHPVVPHTHRLCLLQMGVSGNHYLEVTLRIVKKNGHQLREGKPHLPHLPAQIKTHRGACLIVPTAPHVELGPQASQNFDEPGLHIHVHILKLHRGLQSSGEHLLANLFEPLQKLGPLLFRKKPHFHQHSNMSHASPYIIFRHGPVKIERLGKPLHHFRRGLFETSFPHTKNLLHKEMPSLGRG